ncbi:MAG: MFS transporter [Syntrophales bacterium]|jgi:MFS family permease|nr:MFS transporter [Syntrophales bacterium]
MLIGREREKGAPVFWGWYVVAGAFLLHAVSYGARYSFGIFVQPLTAENGWSRTVISLAASLNMLFFAAGGIVAGRLLDRIAPRWVASAGAAVGALGFILSAFVDTPLAFYLAYGLLCGLGSSWTGIVVGNSSVGKWFIRKRGMAIGIASMGVSFGTMIMTPVIGWVVKERGWQSGFIVLGLTLLAAGVLIAQIFLGKTKPEAYGLRPDGHRDQPVGDSSGMPGHAAAVPLGEAMRDSRFWILSFCQGAAVMTVLMAFVHQVPYALDLGIDRLAAAASLGAIALAGFFGQFFFGSLSDRLPDPKYSAMLGYLVMAAGLAVLLSATSVEGLFAYALIFGFGYGCLGPILPIIASGRFGRESIGSVYGVLNFFVAGVGGALGPIVGGVLYDALGSYRTVWALDVALLLAAAAGLTALKRRQGDGKTG